MPNPLSGKEKLIVNTWFTQILLIINRSQLPFTLIKLSAKGQLYVAQMGGCSLSNWTLGYSQVKHFLLSLTITCE